MKKFTFLWFMVSASFSLYGMADDTRTHQQAQATALRSAIQKNNPALITSLLTTHQAVIPSHGYILLHTALQEPIQIKTENIEAWARPPIGCTNFYQTDRWAFEHAFKEESRKRMEIIRYLIATGAPLVSSAPKENPILHEAVTLALEHGGELGLHYTDIARKLLLSDVNPFTRNHDGLTALQMLEQKSTTHPLRLVLHAAQSYKLTQARAFLMAQHARTGAASYAAPLPQNLFQDIIHIFLAL